MSNIEVRMRTVAEKIFREKTGFKSIPGRGWVTIDCMGQMELHFRIQHLTESDVNRLSMMILQGEPGNLLYHNEG